MTAFSEEWIRARAGRELEPLGIDVGALRPFPTMDGFERHFVMGADKRGTLWTLEPAFIDGDQKRVLVAVRYHAPAVHMGNSVHGGAISAIVDAFAAAAGLLQLGWDFRAVTKEQTLRFKRSLKLETPYLLIARPTPSSDGLHAADVASTVLGEDDQPRVEAHTLMVIPSRG